MYSWETDEEMIAELLAEGCIKDIRYDDIEGTLVKFHMDVLELKYPAVAEVVKAEQMQEVDESIQELIDKGLVQMSFQETEDGGLEAVYGLTEAGKAHAEYLLNSGNLPS
jgi:predicted transcriptional regulator